jgi:hypothetical protein
MIEAPIRVVVCRLSVNACRAASTTCRPLGPARTLPVCTPPLTDSRAAAAWPSVSDRGSVRSPRYTALSTEPSTAMPSAPPSSIPVSEIAAAAPVLVLGTLARMVSEVTEKVNMMPTPFATRIGSISQ